MEKIKCNPLYCLSVFFIINALLFGWIKYDIYEIRKLVLDRIIGSAQRITYASNWGK